MVDLLVVAALVAAVSWLGIAFTREAGRVATICPASALLIGLLLRASPQRWPTLLAAGLIGNFAANLLAGDSVGVGIVLSLCDVLEVCLAAVPLNRLIGDDRDPVRMAGNAKFMVIWAVWAPVVPSILSAVTLSAAGQGDFLAIFRLCYPADVLGIVVVTPFVMAMNGRIADQLFFGNHRIRNLLALALLLVTTLGVFAQSDLPLLFLVFPPLLFAVFRLNLAGAALGLLIIGAIAAVFTIEGSGPFSLMHEASLHERILMLQFYVAVASVMAYPVGVVLTERRRLQRTLAENERRYRILSENSSDIIVRTAIDGSKRYVSPSCVEILGWSADELLGPSRLDLVHPDDLSAYLEEEARMRRGTRTSRVVYRYRHKNGNYTWLESASRLVRKGSPNGEDEVIKVIRDVSRRKSVEDALAKSERDLRAVADHLPALISFVDADGVLQFCNGTHEQWLGRPEKDLVGLHLSEVFGRRVYDEQHKYLARALSGEAVEFELVLSLNGVTRHTRVNYVPRRSGQGVITGLYSLIMDITAVKMIEKELSRLARFDSLTGLPNRFQFDERFEQALLRGQRNHTPLALLFVDVDRFKSINDTHGHAAGDEVLKGVAQRIRDSIRATDLAARLAGDEFVVVIERPRNPDELQFVARKMLAAIEKPFLIDGHEISVTVSVGIAFVRSCFVSPGEVLHQADVALYSAKAEGRNGWKLVSCAI